MKNKIKNVEQHKKQLCKIPSIENETGILRRSKRIQNMKTAMNTVNVGKNETKIKEKNCKTDTNKKHIKITKSKLADNKNSTINLDHNGKNNKNDRVHEHCTTVNNNIKLNIESTPNKNIESTPNIKQPNTHTTKQRKIDLTIIEKLRLPNKRKDEAFRKQEREKDAERKRKQKLVTRAMNLTKTSNIQLCRKQFPLTPAEAIIIHKSQGATYDNVCVNITSRMDRFMLYVAFSRATSANGLFINGQYITPRNVNKNDKVTIEMLRLRKENPVQLCLKFPEDCEKNSDNFSFLYQNFRSLNKNFNLIKSNISLTSCDILSFVETWTLSNDDLNIPHYAPHYVCC